MHTCSRLSLIAMELLRSESADDDQGFGYQPLANPGSPIRLIEVDPELSSDGKLQIQLFESALSEEYTCLSYAWGQENDGGGPFPILVNGKTFHIRRNLNIFLHIARRKHPKQRIWIDAICIDQNNKAEKSDQVSRMGEIYSRAVKVYAWLGKASRETDLVFAVLQQFRDRKKEEACPAYFDTAEELSFHQQPLYARCYWRRVWIVQELV
ncbi:HET-domain-containing protein, partial [Periconia macrospinosa]